jgi:acyl carrier protein
MYRTGDLARWRGDGTIEFLGRLDRQVKVNGVRVEPAEIEAAILRHPAIGQAAVQVIRGDDGGARLLARLTARSSGQPSNAELRRFLGSVLPPQLIPSDFQYLDQMPLTQTGKVDRQALVGQEPAAQQPSVQASIGRIWADILGHDDFGENDSFFDLGGKSFDAMELVSRIRTTFHGDIPVQVLLRSPTIAAMTGKIHDLLAGREMTID